MAVSILAPVAYIATLIIALLLFSRVYRARQAAAFAKTHKPWFDGHPERDVYQTLVAAQNDQIPEEVLKAALLSRAMTDVRRIIRMRDDKQALAVLAQKGSIGDETMAHFALAEKELEAEILDVVSEANTYREGWGQIIFPTASEMVAHLKHKEIYYGIQTQRQEETEALEKAGKPVPKPTIELPPLVTPPGTTIQVQAAPQGGQHSITQMSVNAPGATPVEGDGFGDASSAAAPTPAAAQRTPKKLGPAAAAKASPSPSKSKFAATVADEEDEDDDA
ncbi:Translocation protein S66 [Tilletia horrida]|uniref:Translocation protein S66 n=1 Tax=Tilletia horrida TaxID=155126 RepID=A0AAN6G730_9BASI|nr:Translocation protein S66 [Tilletia horrida]KAK0560315.1 Translocation protein S66 [Tilletia horrida]